MDKIVNSRFSDVNATPRLAPAIRPFRSDPPLEGACHAPHRRPPVRPTRSAISRRVVESVAGLTQSVLGKKLPVIAITLQYIPHEQWFIGGQALSELGRNAFHLDISVTDETNTKAEKARYIQDIYDAFRGILGELHECSYVHVIDARAVWVWRPDAGIPASARLRRGPRSQSASRLSGQRKCPLSDQGAFSSTSDAGSASRGRAPRHATPPIRGRRACARALAGSACAGGSTWASVRPVRRRR